MSLNILPLLHVQGGESSNLLGRLRFPEFPIWNTEHNEKSKDARRPSPGALGYFTSLNPRLQNRQCSSQNSQVLKFQETSN
jgi:hypothetical protein